MTDKRKKISKILKGNPAIDFAYLFGSRVKALAGKRSDWDVAIYFKKELENLPPWTVFYLEAEMAREIGEEVQITVLNNLDAPVLLFQIISNGLLLVDNNPERRVLFEAHVLKKYHDWHYFLRRQMTMKNPAIKP